LRYNFSNGVQISAKEILRHPLHRKVIGDLLPQAKSATSVFAQWPLSQQGDGSFVSHAVTELEEILQALLSHVAMKHRQGKLELYLQTKNAPGKAMKIHSIEFDPAQEVDWRVDFTERKELETEFKLVSFRKQVLTFFESFAVEPNDQILLVHPWQREFSSLQQTLSRLGGETLQAEGKMPTIHALGEMPAKAILKHLRSRLIPVKVTGESRTLSPHQSQTEVRLDENGAFYVQHEARVFGQKNLVRKGWTSKTVLYLHTLSNGIPFLLKEEAKEIATRARTKREWDMKILKHLGILQYLFTETLSLHFDGTLLDGTRVEKKALFSSLHEKIQSLLIAGTGGIFVRDVPLADLCSKSVLACFEDFIEIALKSTEASESFYSEQGEVILEGVVEREFRLLFEMLKKMALTTSGEAFRRSRTPLLSKTYSGDF
jgi:hypothetical protein